MRRHASFKPIVSVLLAAVMVIGMVGCASNTPNNTPASNNQGEETPQSASVNTKTINVVWYPNESSNTHADVRAEINSLIEQATGRKAVAQTTTDYTIAIEALASGSADIAMAMGAVGYIEAKNRNPQVDVLFVNGDKHGKLDEAKYFSWICVNTENADDYKNGGTFSIDNIKGKKMSFVSNSSTSGFRVPTSSIISHFTSDNLEEDDLLPDGKFFSEVFFGQSHQGSAISLITGNVDAAAFCDIELQPYIELRSGEYNTVGAVYAIKQGADAPFNAHIGKEFTVIACTPVFNGPNAYNPKNLSADEIKAIRDLFVSAEVSNNAKIFFDGDDPDAFGLYKKSSSKGYVLASDSWYDPYR